MVTVLEGPSEDLTFIDWHPKGYVLLCGSVDRSAWMFNAANGEVMESFFGHEQEINCGGFTPNGKKVVTAGADCSLRIWFP